jgi:hypothetical protein
MNLGDKVVRNPRYDWCLCLGYAGCWCRGAQPFTIETVDRTGKSQSGLQVKACRGDRVLPLMDSSYFLPADGKESLGAGEDLFPEVPKPRKGEPLI